MLTGSASNRVILQQKTAQLMSFRFAPSFVWDLLEILHEGRSKFEKIAIQPVRNLQCNATRQNGEQSFVGLRQDNKSRIMSLNFKTP